MTLGHLAVAMVICNVLYTTPSAAVSDKSGLVYKCAGDGFDSTCCWVKIDAGGCVLLEGPVRIESELDLVPTAPQNVLATKINSTSYRISWTQPSAPNGIIIRYRVYYKKKDAKERQNELGATAATYTVALNGLEASTTYEVETVAFTAKGDGERSKAIYFTTPGLPPSEPQRVSATPRDGAFVMVRWGPPGISNGDITNYMIFWQRRDQQGGEQTTTVAGDVNKVQLGQSDFNKGASYEIWVRASNPNGQGPPSLKQTVQLSAVPPTAPPQNIQNSWQNETAMMLTWDPPQLRYRGGNITQYEVRVYTPKEQSPAANANTTESKLMMVYNVTNVVPRLQVIGVAVDQQYSFSIAASTSAGPGPWSDRQQFTHKRPTDTSITDITGLKIAVIGDDRYKLSWGRPGIAIKKYEITVTTQSGQKKVYNPTDTTLLEYTVVDEDGSLKGGFGAKVRGITDSQNLDSIVFTYDPNNSIQCNKKNNAWVTNVGNLVTISWSPTNLDDYKTKIVYSGRKKYNDEYGLNQTKIDPLADVIVNASVGSVRFDALLANMKYTFTAELLTKTNTICPATRMTHTTSKAKAPVPSEKPSLSAKDITVDGATQKQLVLKPPMFASKNGRPAFYEVFIAPVDFNKFTELKPDAKEIHRDRKHPTFQLWCALAYNTQQGQMSYELGKNDYIDFRTDQGAEWYSRRRCYNRALEKDKQYIVWVRAYTKEVDVTNTPSFKYNVLRKRSTDSVKLLYTDSKPSDPFTSNGPELMPSSMSTSLLFIVGPIVGIIILLLVIILVIILIKSQHPATKAPRPKDETPLFIQEPPPSTTPPVTVPVQIPQQTTVVLQPDSRSSHPIVPIAQLAEHIEKLRTNDNQRFLAEFESIESGMPFTWTASTQEVNRAKNRYANIIAYDHSRVQLQPIEGILGSDYINANHCDGYRQKNAYISTQGPLPETFGDFWRMVWEQNVSIVVMMTKLEERGRTKCDQYWPSRGAELYDLVQVTVVEVLELAHYTLRTFQLSYGGEKREVRQFQFTAWPDHGVPEHPLHLLLFIRRVRAAMTGNAPVVVHCSAGVGRTGAYIVLDAQLERMRQESGVDVYGHVTGLRAQRNYMVQTEEQYIFIHDSLLEAASAGLTEIPVKSLFQQVQRLMAADPGETVTGLEQEFRRLTSHRPPPEKFSAASAVVNKFKSRQVSVLPYDSTRVALAPVRGVEGSDYINASYIDGYRQRRAYIAAQGPLVETIDDMWRLLWEQGSTIIVMLCKLKEMGREKSSQYWPSDRSTRYQYFVVDPISEYNMPQYILREFKVTDARAGQSRTVRQFQFLEWPEQGVPKSGEAFIDFIGQVHKTKEQFGAEGPIAVHCSAGVGRTGVFVALSIILDQMRYEGVADVFQTVRLLRLQRPHMVQTEEQYRFCYRAALEYLSSFDHYTG